MSLSPKKIALMREMIDFICEECHKHEEVVGTLQPHRLTRGFDGGKYEYRNLKMVCKSCHKEYHGGEFQ